jgi:hypothetical protein
MEYNRRPRYNPCSYSQLNFDKHKAYNGEKTTPSTNVAGKSTYPHTEDWNDIPVSHLVLIPTLT